MRRRLYKRTLLVVVIAQIFGGAGLAAGVTVGALIVQDIWGSESLAGFPSALITLGSAAAALLVGRLTHHYGRRPGLSAGFLFGGIGAIGVIIGTVYQNMFLLFTSLFLYGAGTAVNLMVRYAGTDLAEPNQRATAVSVALVSTTLGAVAGPNLVDVTGRLAVSIGIPALAGPFLLSAAAFVLAGMILMVFLRPDPLLAAKAMAKTQSEEQKKAPMQSGTIRAVTQRGVLVGTSVMILTQIVMVAIMTMTPIHMQHHGHGLNEVGFVISVHIGAMYLPSLVTGILVDRYGRMAMSIAAGAVLLASGILAALVPAGSLFGITAALALLGIGWNLGFISGTAIIVDATNVNNRAKTQGAVDVLIALSGASGGALSGLVVDQSSYTVLSFAGGFLALLLIPVVIWSQAQHRKSREEYANLS